MFSFSCVYDRSLVVPSTSDGMVFSAPWWRVLVGSALSSGACRWRLRASSRSFSGSVVVVGFRSLSSAEAFASSWSFWCGVPVASGGVPCSRVWVSRLPSVSKWVVR